MTSNPTLLLQKFPFTSTPFLCSGPMRTISGPSLAVAVSKAGGLGFYGAGYDLAPLSTSLSLARSLFNISDSTSTLPIGFGVIVWGASLSLALEAIVKYRPIAVWLFAPKDNEQLETWILEIKATVAAAGGEIVVFVQIGSVDEAEKVLSGPAGEGVDVLVVQGVADSGGHGLGRGGSVISVLPEVVDLVERLKREGRLGMDRCLPIIAAGGVVDGRGFAACLALGADGVCMGTRFVACPESEAPSGFQQYLVDMKDGGQNTVRTRLYDNLRGTGNWPSQYNGRAAVNSSFKDHEKGLDEKPNQEAYEKAVKDNDYERLTVFTGTGVGLIKDIKSAERIVKDTQAEALEIIALTAKRYPL